MPERKFSWTQVKVAMRVAFHSFVQCEGGESPFGRCTGSTCTKVALKMYCTALHNTSPHQLSILLKSAPHGKRESAASAADCKLQPKPSTALGSPHSNLSCRARADEQVARREHELLGGDAACPPRCEGVHVAHLVHGPHRAVRPLVQRDLLGGRLAG